MIVTRASAASAFGSHTAIGALPARSCSTFTTWMPPWLWPIIIGMTPSFS